MPTSPVTIISTIAGPCPSSSRRCLSRPELAAEALPSPVASERLAEEVPFAAVDSVYSSDPRYTGREEYSGIDHLSQGHNEADTVVGAQRSDPGHRSDRH